MYLERRRAKGVTEMEAREIARRPLYRAALMVAAGDADGGAGGAVNTDGGNGSGGIAMHRSWRRDRARISAVFFMCVQDRAFGHEGVLAFADCAMVVDPSAAEVAEIAIATARSTRTVIGAEPRVALLSFSTKGSARHPYIEKMVEALRILRERAPEIECDGELQADAALVSRRRIQSARIDRRGAREHVSFSPTWRARISATSWSSDWAARRHSVRFCKGSPSRSTICRADVRRTIFMAAAIVTALQSEIR